MNTVPVASAATEYLFSKATAAGVPLSGTFELTPVCNMDCKMCYVRMSRQAQEEAGPLASGAQWLELARKARDAGMLYLLITGGEPMLHPDFRQIMEALHAMGLLVTLNSNGTMVDADTVQWLKNCPPVRVNISLYGASDETYHQLCGNPKGFTQTVNAIDLLQSAGISVKLNCSLTPHNAHDLPAMVAFAKERGLIMQVATYMFPPVRKDISMAGKNARFTPQDAAYYMAYADYLTLGPERFLQQQASCPVFEPGEDLCGQSPEGIRCRAGRCSFWITWQGNILPCGMFLGGDSPNVFTTDFSSAWQQIKEYTSGIRLPEKCAGCSAKDICHACAAMVISESGCFDKLPQYRCDMVHAYKAQWDRVREEML